jgi:putative membrane protein
MKLLLRWLAAAAAVAVAVHLLPGITYDGRVSTLLVVALLLGLVNSLVRPVLTMLSCGVIVLTLGLFLLVINAAMLLLAGWLARQFGYGFHVDGFLTAMIGSLIVSFTSWAISMLLSGSERGRPRRR